MFLQRLWIHNYNLTNYFLLKTLNPVKQTVLWASSVSSVALFSLPLCSDAPYVTVKLPWQKIKFAATGCWTKCNLETRRGSFHGGIRGGICFTSTSLILKNPSKQKSQHFDNSQVKSIQLVQRAQNMTVPSKNSGKRKGSKRFTWSANNYCETNWSLFSADFAIQQSQNCTRGVEGSPLGNCNICYQPRFRSKCWLLTEKHLVNEH